MRNIFLIPTEQESWICLKDGKLVNANDGGCMLGYDPPRWLTQHLYITLSEKINVGDWFYVLGYTEGCIQKCFEADEKTINGMFSEDHYGNRVFREQAVKVILTTDPNLIENGIQEVPNYFLEWLCNNQTFEYVEVDKLKRTIGFDSLDETYFDYVIKIPEVKCYDKNNQLLKEGDYVDVQKEGIYQIYKKEDNQLYFKPYGEEEKVSDYFSNDMIKCNIVEHSDNSIEPETFEDAISELGKTIYNIVDKYKIKQSKNTYSEEEVLELLNKRELYLGKKSCYDWFQQNKKK